MSDETREYRFALSFENVAVRIPAEPGWHALVSVIGDDMKPLEKPDGTGVVVQVPIVEWGLVPVGILDRNAGSGIGALFGIGAGGPPEWHAVARVGAQPIKTVLRYCPPDETLAQSIEAFDRQYLGDAAYEKRKREAEEKAKASS